MANGSEHGINKRQFKRLNLELNVKVAFKIGGETRFLDLKSRNISQQGICLEAAQNQAETLDIISNSSSFESTPFDMEITLPPGNTPVNMHGKACWYDITREKEHFKYQISIAFIKPGQKEDGLLKDFLKKQSENGGFLKRLFSPRSVLKIS